MNHTAERIAALRSEKGLTQDNLADLLLVSRSLVSLWELGIRMPDYQNVMKLAEVFNVKEVEIVGEEQYVYSSDYELKRVLREIADFADQTESTNSKEDRKKAIKEFLAELSEKDRNLFMSRFFWVKTYKAIASDFDMSEAAVKVRISRIRKKLEKEIRGV